ncbi:hypothetical protein B0J13DRAFT_564709 [Dactylonectria estremocensis]|uniref:Uncharacterized protein n=1 Tax=Dactylonectria estremocensis TaxID=1079267 RepID=A0A9P9DZH9_9HYPO|nr:hypothetical protein B0J13DRAFT_564709 [Dactylonectria estremocensis]
MSSKNSHKPSFEVKVGPRFSDGPLLRHPDEIDLDMNYMKLASADISKQDHKSALAETRRELREKADMGTILDVIVAASSIDMARLIRTYSDKQVKELVERWYVNAQIYLRPGSSMPLGLCERYRHDWGLNAEGIYYRHHFSHHWVEGFERKLWVPSVAALDWNLETESTRRQRAKKFVKHALDNEKWNKSEYAWEADAWSDVFGQMREDPLLAGNKHEYFTVDQKKHPVSCLLTGEAIGGTKRIPDATFGLATFDAQDGQNTLACDELNRDKLKALALHPQTELISDPKLGDANLVFPFAVYEAKGWSGDARVARYQACSAGAVYLDILDALARHPFPMEIPGYGRPYQSLDSQNTQIFALTSFGAHWHILVGYRRNRLEREHAGTNGVSKTVYLFQRVWSDRVVTERSAWELLSLVDQIHQWGVNQFRSFVIKHLKAWHEFCSNCYGEDAELMSQLPKLDSGTKRFTWQIPVFTSPEWSKDLEPARRKALQQDACAYLVQTYIQNLGPHSDSDLKALTQLMERFKRGGDSVKTWALDLPDGISDENGDNKTERLIEHLRKKADMEKGPSYTGSPGGDSSPPECEEHRESVDGNHVVDGEPPPKKKARYTIQVEEFEATPLL